MEKRNWKRMRPYFISLIKAGRTDKEIVPLMQKRFKGNWTVHMIRSERGRLERAGEVKVGLSGSSKGKTKMARSRKGKRFHQRWTMTAMLRAVKLREEGLKPEAISRVLVKEKQRKHHNPGAVSDMFRRANLPKIQEKLRDQKPELPFEDLKAETPTGEFSVTFNNPKGSVTFNDLPSGVYTYVLQYCLDAQFEVGA